MIQHVPVSRWLESHKCAAVALTWLIKPQLCVILYGEIHLVALSDQRIPRVVKYVPFFCLIMGKLFIFDP